MLYFIDPDTEETRAFLTEEDRDVFAPNCTLQMPEGMAPDSHYCKVVDGELYCVPTPPQLTEQLHKLKALLAEATLHISPLLDAKDLNVATPVERDKLEALQRYRLALYHLPQTEGWPTAVHWPEPPPSPF